MHVEVNGVRLFYNDSGGNGVPLVLIPGLGTTHMFFAGLVERLSARYRVIGLVQTSLYSQSLTPLPGCDRAGPVKK